MGVAISVVVPARNEAGNLAPCVDTILAALDGLTDRYEVIIVDDGSTDATGEVAERLAATRPGVRAVHNRPARGFARAYRDGAALATHDYVALVPGDDEIEPVSVRAMFEAVGTADVVVPVTANQERRPWLRRALSRTFTGMVNGLFGYGLGYYQGPCIYPAAVLRSIPVTTDGFVFLTEMLVRALAAGLRPVAVPMYIRPRQFGASSAVSARNVRTALTTLARLLWDVRVRRRPLG
jgi:glycosyltransferase involved in cell wall biosynthesis